MVFVVFVCNGFRMERLSAPRIGARKGVLQNQVGTSVPVFKAVFKIPGCLRERNACGPARSACSNRASRLWTVDPGAPDTDHRAFSPKIRLFSGQETGLPASMGHSGTCRESRFEHSEKDQSS